MTPKRPTRRRFGSSRSLAFFAVLALLLVVDSGSALARGDRPLTERAAEALPDLPKATATVVFGQDTVIAEVARSQEERSRGLMYRETLGEDAGMLFIFPDNAVRSFWMQNTYIPLDIAFLDPSFRVVDIQQMEAMSTEQRSARAPFTYALEVNEGWFAAHGIRVGDLAQVSFDPGQ